MKKILIVSAHCLSHHDANGRSLLNLLGKFKPEQLYQFSTVSEEIYEIHCNSYLQITDKNALLSFFGKKICEKKILKDHAVGKNEKVAFSKKIKKTSFAMLLRDFVWNNSIGVKLSFRKWVDSFKPDLVILQLGDSTNLVKLTIDVLKRFDIPLIIYNTEDYYFKEYDYMKKTFSPGFLYKFFHSLYKQSIKKLMRFSPTIVCNCNGIKDLFEKEFSSSCFVLYNSSDSIAQNDNCQKTNKSIVYAGNLGLGRHKSLIEIGRVLKTIDEKLCLDIFGNAPDSDVVAEFDSEQNINYHGWVDYNKVQEIIKSSSLLIHTESFDEYQKLDTRFAFSTKIADYLASGVPMFFYAPDTGEGFKHIKENLAGFVVSKKEDVFKTLNDALFDLDKRNEVVKNAKALLHNKHNINSNQDFIYNLIISLTKERQVDEF